MLKEGVFLGKRYEILERIGSGGMADVYKGKDHKLNRFVAIKVLKSDFRSDEMFIQKFLSEAQAAAGLMHPNVVNVYDVGQDRGLYYMVMELVEGITLKDYIEKKGRLSAKETISISIQMVTGIQAAHHQHIVHRDIKPQNIIISKDGKVKVTDFGIARASTSSNTISTNVMGSVHYTSPEQARGGVVDEKSDIYSAGITMYEMITGHVPFDGDSTVSVAIKHLQEEIVSPAVEVPDIPKSLENIILKCTQKSTAMRYQNCEELILDLKRSLMDPEGQFVGSGSARRKLTDETILMGTQEMEKMQMKGYPLNGEDPDDDYEDDDDSYDNSVRRRDADRRRAQQRGNREEVNPQMKKVTKILMIVAAVIIAFAVIFGVSKAFGVFGGGKAAVTTKETKVEVPDIRGMTEKEAKELLNKKGLGIQRTGYEPSDKYDKNEIISSTPQSGEKVDKNTTIKVIVSSGPEAKEVSVPNVVNKSESDAQKILEEEGLVVDTEFAYDNSVPDGNVISTDPAAGTMVEEGTSVKMIVSKGKEQVSVPDLKGKSAQDANAALAAVGLSAGSVSEEYSDSVAAGLVISQGTEVGKKVDKGSSVDYVISKGKKIETVTVPSLTGSDLEGAKQKLSENGLSVGNITYEYSASVPEGYVISQTAAAGSQVEKGTFVGLVISKGPETIDPPDPGEGGDGTEGQP